MKSTGVVRRIDELGRIVIPKEIRKNLRIGEGENLEIYIEQDKIILKKHSTIKELEDFAFKFTEAIYSFIKGNIIITDRENIIAVSGPLKKEISNKELSKELLASLNRRENILENHKKELKLTNNKKIECTDIIKTITVESEVVGMLIIVNEINKIGEIEEKIANICVNFLEKYLEQ